MCVCAYIRVCVYTYVYRHLETVVDSGGAKEKYPNFMKDAKYCVPSSGTLFEVTFSLSSADALHKTDFSTVKIINRLPLFQEENKK